MKILLLIFICLFSFQTAFAASNANSIGWSLFAKQTALNQNVCISPVSIETALRLTFTGAAGETKAAGFKFLGEADIDDTNDLSQLTDAENKISISNAIWTNSKSSNVKAPHPDFVKAARTRFGAEIRRVPFTPAEPVAASINSWVSKKTERMIEKLVSEHDLEGRDAAILNAVYFKGTWQTPFLKALTKASEFRASSGSLKTPFMEKEAEYRYAESTDLQILELPYRGGRLAMDILLPSKAVPLSNSVKELSTTEIEKRLSALKTETVHVQIPKFEMKWGTTDLAQDLAVMGLPKSGDFSPLGLNHFTIGGILHKTRVRVDEVGTEAAAATALLAFGASAPAKALDFIADRPFLFIIREAKPEGRWLFLGQLVKP